MWSNKMDGYIEKLLSERRSMGTALDDLLAEYQRNPHPPLARTIALLQAEIELKKRPHLGAPERFNRNLPPFAGPASA